MHILILSIWLLLMLGALYICWQVVEVYKSSNSTKRKDMERKQRQYHIQELVRQGKERAKRQQRQAPKSRPTTETRRETANPQLWNQLITMVQGDTAAATRLVRHEQARHPNQSEKWLVEKAIWQLERDRR